MIPHPENTPLQNAVAMVIAQARAEGAPYGMSPSLVIRLWARSRTVADALRDADLEARKFGITVEWVIKIWNTGGNVGEVMAEAKKMRRQ